MHLPQNSERRSSDQNSWGSEFNAQWGNILFAGFICFHIVKPLMPILQKLPILAFFVKNSPLFAGPDGSSACFLSTWSSDSPLVRHLLTVKRYACHYCQLYMLVKNSNAFEVLNRSVWKYYISGATRKWSLLDAQKYKHKVCNYFCLLWFE